MIVLENGDLIKFKDRTFRVKGVETIECKKLNPLPGGAEWIKLGGKTVLDLEALEDKPEIKEKVKVIHFCMELGFHERGLRFGLSNGDLVQFKVTREGIRDMVNKYGNSQISIFNGFLELVNSLEIPDDYKKALSKYLEENISTIIGYMGEWG